MIALQPGTVSVDFFINNEKVTVSAENYAHVDGQLTKLVELLQIGTPVYYTTGFEADEAYKHLYKVCHTHGGPAIYTYVDGKANYPVYFDTDGDLVAGMRDILLHFHRTRRSWVGTDLTIYRGKNEWKPEFRKG